MMTLHVRVTFWDILLGMPSEALLCPIARAIGRAFASAGHPPMFCKVYHGSATVWLEDHAVKIRLPSAAAAFERRLDERGRLHVRPFAFDLVILAAIRAEIPAEALEGVAS
jgi:hypothetical protein